MEQTPVGPAGQGMIVSFPRRRCVDDIKTFEQEGWHYELEDPKDDLIFKVRFPSPTHVLLPWPKGRDSLPEDCGGSSVPGRRWLSKRSTGNWEQTVLLGHPCVGATELPLMLSV